jgi:hypothetical protein
VGTFENGLTIDDKAVFERRAAQEYVFVVRLTENGLLRWVRIFGTITGFSDGGVESDIADDTSVVVVATCSSECHIYSPEDTSIKVRGRGLVGAAFDEFGNIEWAGPIGEGNVWPLDVVALDSKVIHLAGSTVRGFTCGDLTAVVPEQSMFGLLFFSTDLR